MIVRDKPVLIVMMRQLIQALQSLHQKAGYAHMDIKLENILIGDDGELKICDFGFSAPIKALIELRLGTPIYMAPEVH